MCLLFIFWRLRGPREGSQFTRSLGSSATTWKSTYEPGRQVLFCDVYYCVTSLALGYWLVTKENSFLNTHTVVCGLNPLWKWALQAEETMDRAAFFPETSWLLGAACPSFIANTARASRSGQEGICTSKLDTSSTAGGGVTLDISGGCQHFLACGPITPISSSMVIMPPPLYVHLLFCLSQISLRLPLIRTLVVTFRAHQIIKIISLSLDPSLNHIYKVFFFFFFCHVSNCHKFQELGGR